MYELRQKGVLAEYWKTFVERVTHLEHISEVVMIKTFLCGLKEKVKTKLSVLGKTTLDRTMDCDEKNDSKLGAYTWIRRRWIY